MKAAINNLLEVLPQDALKTFTSDRGKEFACYPEIEEQGIDFFTLQIPIALGKEERMRTRMVY